MRRGAGAAALAIALGTGCAHVPPSQPTLELFAPEPDDDHWSPMIRLWQADRRLETEEPRPLPPLAISDLGRDYERFVSDLRLQVVRRVLRFVQLSGGLYYRFDGDRDHWPTLAQVVEGGGDDCDGLDLLTFETLRSIGFGPGELWRAVIAEPASGRHHMVTLWFDGKDADDPWVLDPTGDAAPGLARLSSVRGWTPVALFDETRQFRVARR
jgi:hypothetical protein